MRIRAFRATALTACFCFTATSLAPLSAVAAPESPGDTPATGDKTQKEGTPASEAERRKESTVHWEQGMALYNDGDYKLARIEWKRAYDLAPNWRMLFNIGQVNLQLSNWAEARAALEKYLAEGNPKEISKQRRQDVMKDIASLNARTAHLTITTNVEGATILLDDAALGTAPVKAALVDAGTHRITASKEGRVTTTATVTLAGGDNITQTMELSEVPAAPPPAAGPSYVFAPQQTGPTQPPGHDQPPPNYTWIGWVATGAFAAGAATTGILALSARSSLDTEKKGVTTADELESTHSRAQTLGYVTDALIGAAVISAGVTLYFTLKHPRDRKQVHVGFGPGTANVYGSF